MLGVEARALAVYEVNIQLEIGRGTPQGLVESCYDAASNARARPMLFCEDRELL